METDQTNFDVLNGIMGRALVGWHLGDGGIHFDLDDGRVLVLAGAFVVAVYAAEENVLH